MLKTLHAAAMVFLGTMLTLSPWLFGSWEMWMFWPMVALLCIACLCSGAGILAQVLLPRYEDDEETPEAFKLSRIPRRALILIALWIPFILYALIRANIQLLPDRPIVARDAQRALLLYTTPIAVALVLLFSGTPRSRKMLLWSLFVNAILVSVAGLISHFATNDTQILWVAVNDFHYTGRLSGSFYCPNDYSPYIGSFQFLLLATLFVPRVRRRVFIPCLILFLALCIPNFLSLSRGGVGAFCISSALLLPTVALRGHHPLKRALFSLFAVLLVGGAFLAIRYTDNPLMQRVQGHPLWTTWKSSENFADYQTKFADAFWHRFDRGTYIASSLRAWKSSPVWGTGPGQHSGRWLEFSATEDGIRLNDPEGRPFQMPRLMNANGYHLYEVHSDWTQLLEECGIAGFCLFLIPVFGLITALYLRQGALLEADPEISDMDRALPLAALLMMGLFIVQSFFDFSLQMPAVLWTFAALLTIALSEPEHARRI